MKSVKAINSRQRTFYNLFVGTLIYAVVIGFFNDYTDIVEAKSFSTIFLASFVLEVLTYLTLLLKDVAVKRHSNSKNSDRLGVKVFIIWLIMFVSKFVFIWVVDLIFGDNININGFFGILLVVVLATIIQKLAILMFVRLGHQSIPRAKIIRTNKHEE